MKRMAASILVTTGLLFSGCGEDQTPQPETPDAAVDGGQYLLDAEPAGALGVIESRENAKDGDLLVVVGRIGGSVNPWVEGLAAFFIVDPSLRACSDIEGDECEVPWDYCCETDRLPDAMALIKLIDDSGELVAADSRNLLGVKELQTIVVEGKAQRDEAGNLTILASGVYVKS